MSDAISTAMELHGAGQLDAAAEIYERVLAEGPHDAEVLYLFGLLRSQRGDHAGAAKLIDRLVALEPNVPRNHATLSEICRVMGDLPRAVGCCRTALALWPDDLDALCGLGLALQAMGRHADAVEAFARLLEAHPETALAHNNLGVSLHALGRDDDALEHFRRATELDPDFVPSRISLGQLLSDSGRFEEALPHCREAVRLLPGSAASHFNLGLVLEALGESLEARGSFLECLRLDPDIAEPYAHISRTLMAAGRHDEALPWIKRALQMDGENIGYLKFLAEIQEEREEDAEVVACWERIVALSPADCLDHRLGLGHALREDGRLDEAEEQFRIALSLGPDSAAANTSMGLLQVEAGDFARAEAFFRDAIRLKPDHNGAHVQLAMLLRGELPEPDIEALEGRLADPGLTQWFRARLLFGLAHVLDARGDYSRAADCLRDANALELGMTPYASQYHPACRRRLVDELLGAFDASFFERVAQGGLATRRPVFVFGLPRSGTTLIEQILASHPRVHGAGELRLTIKSFQAIPALFDDAEAPVQYVPQLDAAAVRSLAEAQCDKLGSLDGGRADRIVDKMPENYLYLGLLAAMFPNATFIHCRRDLRDTALSCWMTNFRKIRWTNHPEHIASCFENYLRCMEAWSSVLPVEVHEVRYEDTVSDLEGVARRLVEACRLDWDPACLEFYRLRRPVHTASLTQVRQPVYRRSAGRWTRYKDFIPELFSILPGRDNTLFNGVADRSPHLVSV